MRALCAKKSSRLLLCRCCQKALGPVALLADCSSRARVDRKFVAVTMMNRFGG